MPNISTDELGDSLNRTLKGVLDTGEAATLEEAQRMFESYRLRVAVGPNVALSPTRQATLLTIVNTARRCFLGGVEVVGCPDASLLLRWRDCRDLREAVADLGGLHVSPDNDEVPVICIGDGAPLKSEFAVRATFDGWRGAVVPLADEPLPEQREFTPAGVMAGALAVSEAFQYVRGRNALAGRRAVGLSLWKPELESWRDDCGTGPELAFLPSKLWIIGLGHLGQAYLWTLGFLPYASPADVEIVLQDFDLLKASNDSTSVLTHQALLGQRKTRAMAQWCEQRGFRTNIVERLFDGDFKVQADEPQVALCGVDNPQARACLQEVGFAEVIEAGLGSEAEKYLGLQVHSFSDAVTTKSARDTWGGLTDDKDNLDSLTVRPAYQAMQQEGADVCGLTTLAGRAVGASFVGVFTSALVVAELLRMTMGAHRYSVVDLSLRNPDRLQVLQRPAAEPRNLGWALCHREMI